MRSEPWSVRKRIGVALTVIIATPAVIVFGGVALVIAYFVYWSNAGAFFSGDGVYRKGVDGAAFQVAFPAVDLSRKGRTTFHFTRMAPPMGYTVGLRVASRSPAVVTMTLANERNETIFRESGPLSQWMWRKDMASIDGKRTEVPIDDRGSVRIERLGVGPDGGWGTHFEPRWSGHYTLTIDVLEADPSRTVARPVIEGYMAWF